jgi:hypothetical protein
MEFWRQIPFFNFWGQNFARIHHKKKSLTQNSEHHIMRGGCAKWTLRGSETAIVCKGRDYGSFRNRVVFILVSHFTKCPPSVIVNYEVPFFRGISWNVSYFNFCCLCEVALKGAESHSAKSWLL